MTHGGPDVSERLTQAFATWQLYYFGHELEVLKLHQQGFADERDVEVSQRGSRLADAILDNTVTALRAEEWQPDQKFHEAGAGFVKQLNVYSTFPLELFRWNRCSRRVFHLPHALEAMLAAAEFPDMKWGDVLWPFESFIITIERPIVVCHPIDHGDQSFDTIMVTKTTRDDGAAYVLFRWLNVPPKSGIRLGFTVSEMREFRSLIQKKPPAATKLWGRRFKELKRLGQYQFGSQHAGFEVRLDENIIVEPEVLYEKLGGMLDGAGNRYDVESTRSFFEGLSVTLRIVVGWMLYLETLSGDSMVWRPSVSTGPRRIAGGTPAIITEPERICDIVGKGRISPSEVTSVQQRNGRGFVRPHWRRAHYKRPRGSPPDAPKTVRIPPVLVRADLVPLYGVVGGTRTVVMLEG